MGRKKPIRSKLIQNMGGHLAKPPKFCPYQKQVGRMVWADLTICHSICSKQCRRYKWFCNATNDEKRARWKRLKIKNTNLLFRK